MFRVFAVIVSHADRSGEAWPSQATLARETDLHPQTVREAIYALRRYGCLEVIPGRGREPSRYRCLSPGGYTLPVARRLQAEGSPGTTLRVSPGDYRQPVAHAREYQASSLRSEAEQPGKGQRNGRAPRPAPPPRPEVARLCDLLADLIESNGVPRPRVTQRWLDACRLMIDRDGIPAETVERAMRWATAHEFWRTNILSFPKLRQHYPRLVLQAQAERDRQARPASGAAARAAEHQDHLRALLARAQQQEADERRTG